jgi:phosphoribosyl 1,2-cyclic phosphate phosphodiesterase
MRQRVQRRFTILGCGSSPGVPRIDGEWGACDPANPKNRRTRAAFLVEQIAGDGGETTVVIDTGPDFRSQMIAAGVQAVDAVIYTHAHADHIHGIDDLRIYAVRQRRQVPIHADRATMARIREGFSYCLETPEGSQYPPIVTPHLIEDGILGLTITGAGGPIRFIPIPQIHGSIKSLGYRIGNFAYCCDISGFPDESLPRLKDLDVLIIDALQYKSHPSHLSLSEALDCIAAIKPKRAVLTHMHIPLDYEAVKQATPDHVEPAYDMMQFTVEIDLGDDDV